MKSALRFERNGTLDLVRPGGSLMLGCGTIASGGDRLGPPLRGSLSWRDGITEPTVNALIPVTEGSVATRRSDVAWSWVQTSA